MANMTLVKEGSNFKLYKDAKGARFIRIDGVRMSYPYLGRPSKNENDDGQEVEKYSVKAMLPKETHGAAKAIVEQVIRKMMEENEARVPAAYWFLQDGDEGEKTEMHGHWILGLSSTRRPTARDRKGQVMDDLDKIDDVFYGGAWCHVLLSPWYFNGKAKNSKKTYPKRICAEVTGVVFAKDDEAFGNGRVDESDCWEGVVEDGGDDGMGDDDL